MRITNCLANHHINKNVYLATHCKGTQSGLNSVACRQDHKGMGTKGWMKSVTTGKSQRNVALKGTYITTFQSAEGEVS